MEAAEPIPEGRSEGRTVGTETVRQHRILLIGAVVAVGITAVAYHSVMAAREVHPGHADYSYYFGLAKNLRSGRGFGVDYIWHFLNVPGSLDNLPNDYWMPLPSILMAGALFVFGTSLRAALTVCLLAWLSTGVLTWVAGKRLTGSTELGVAAGIGALILPGMISASLLTDGSALFAMFSMAVVVTVLHANGRFLWYLLAGAFVGFAELTRQDGLLLGATVCAGAIALVPRGRRLLVLGTAFIAYLFVMAPMFIANLRTFGAPLPPGPRSAAFLLTYEDLYSYGRVSASTYFRAPARFLLQQRLDWVEPAAGQFVGLVGGRAMAVVLVVGTVFVATRRARRWEWLVAATFPVVLTLFHSLFLPVVSTAGGWARSILAASPMLVIGLIAFASWLIQIARASAMGRRTGMVATWALMIVMGVIVATRSHVAISRTIGQQSLEKARILAVNRFIPEGNAVLMTRNPWEWNEVTGRRAVQIPNENIETILRIACATGASYLLADPTRAALRDLGPEVESGRMGSVSPQVGLYKIVSC